jgi:hypothetical protein
MQEDRRARRQRPRSSPEGKRREVGALSLGRLGEVDLKAHVLDQLALYVGMTHQDSVIYITRRVS